MKTYKNNTISVSKGIGIILMVIGHCYLSGFVNHYIYCFHMPLFFFISGYCFNTKYFLDYKTFFFRKIKSLYLPFIKYNILFIILHNILSSFYLVQDEYSFTELTKKIFLTIFLMEGTEQLLGGFWFLKQLLLASMGSYFILKYIHRSIIQIIILLLLIFLFDLYKLNIPYINCGSQTLLATLFYIIGYKFQGINIKGDFFTIVLSSIIVFLIAIYSPTGIHGTTIYNVIPFIISSIAGIIMTLNFSKFILHKIRIAHLLENLGNNTLIILVYHFISFKIISLIAVLYYDLPIRLLTQFPIIQNLPDKQVWLILYCIIGLIFPLTLNKLYKLILIKINNHAA